MLCFLRNIGFVVTSNVARSYPQSSADMYTITVVTPELSNFALAEIERYRLSRLRFLLPVSISAVSLILSLVALLK